MTLFSWGKGSENVKRAEAMLTEICESFTLSQKTLSKSARGFVSRHNWASEIEMRRAVCFAALASSKQIVEVEHFAPITVKDAEAISGKRFDKLSLEEIVGQKFAHFFETLGKVEASGVHATVIKQVEKPLIEKCLTWAEGNQLKCARVLGINRNTLRKKMRELRIKNIPSPKGRGSG